jgi:hypothetical protein
MFDEHTPFTGYRTQAAGNRIAITCTGRPAAGFASSRRALQNLCNTLGARLTGEDGNWQLHLVEESAVSARELELAVRRVL